LAAVGLFLLGRSVGAADLPGLDADRAGRSVVVPIETQHLGWNAAVPTYLIASYVAVSRLHDNRHYLSDVVFGAATGIIVGRSVTWHGRNNYPIAPVAGPDFLGVSVSWR